MTIVPDGKDWTWVLGRPCPECGLDTQSFAREEIPAMIRANAAAWRAPLAAADAADRPRPDRWSALEYGCHVRDVFRLYDYRLGLMLAEDDPLYPNWDQDETAVADDYAAQNPAMVADELASAADAIAGQLRRRLRRPVAASRPAQRRRRLHGRDLRPLLHARPDPPPARRHRRPIPAETHRGGSGTGRSRCPPRRSARPRGLSGGADVTRRTRASPGDTHRRSS